MNRRETGFCGSMRGVPRRRGDEPVPLDEEVIAITRLVLSESDRFPELGSAFYTDTIGSTRQAMEGWLRRQCNQGLIALEDPHVAADMLRGMMVMEPQRAVMLGQRDAPDAEEIAARAKMCARLFLNGCFLNGCRPDRVTAVSPPVRVNKHVQSECRARVRRGE
jgi:hypothetical protein